MDQRPTWKQPRFLADLTPNMARALVRCHTLTVLVVDHPDDDGGPAAFGIHRATLTALVGHGLVEQRHDKQRDKRMRLAWKPTPVGLALIRTEEPRYLARSSDHLDQADGVPGYTIDAAKAMFPDAGEAVDEVTQKRISDEARDRDLSLAAGVDESLFADLTVLRAQRHELARIAQARGLDLRSQVRLIDRAQNALEQQIRQQRDSARRAA